MENIRVNRLFSKNSRSFVVAMDHPRVFDVITDLRNILKISNQVIEAGADALLTPYGATNYLVKNGLKNGFWLSVDIDAYSSKSIVESCLMLGADGIKVEVYPWCTKEDDYLKKYTGNESIVNAANLATECRKWNIPLMVESIPFGWPKADNRNPEIIAAAARVASELGADYVKTFYTGDKDSFSKVVQNSLVPVLVLGGPKIDSDLEVLQMVRDAIDAGAVGITMGRNIWGHPNVVGMSAALTKIIHDDASAETAYRLIQ